MLRVPTMPVDELPPLRGATWSTGGGPSPPPRTTRTVLEDIFHTYTGCATIQSFFDLQKDGARLCTALKQGSGLPVAAAQPHVQPALQSWYAAMQARCHSQEAAATTRELTAKCDLRDRVAAGRLSTDDHAAADAEADPADEDAGLRAEELLSCMLPPLDELPPVVRCDRAAIVSVRHNVAFYFVRLFELIELTHVFASRWGKLTTSERSRLKEAIQAVKRARLGERELLGTFEELRFDNEQLSTLSAEDVALFHNVRVLRCSYNPAIRELQVLPSACHTAVVCACSLETISATSATVTVLGLSFNRLTDLSFIPQFPSLKVLDLTANRITSIEDTINTVNAHAEIQEVTLAGNPMALLDSYRSSIAAACPRLDRLDGRLILAEERSLQVLGGAEVVPLPTLRKGSSHNGRGHLSTTSLRHRPSSNSKKAAEAAAVAAAAAEAAAKAEKPLALTVGAVAELLLVRGLGSLAHVPITVDLAEDFKPNAEFLQKVAGTPPEPPCECDQGSQPGARAAGNPRAGVQPLDLIGGRATPVSSSPLRKANARRGGKPPPPQQQPTKPASRKGVSSANAASRGSTAGSNAEHASHGRLRANSRNCATQKDSTVSLYEYRSTLVVRGEWGGKGGHSGGENGEESSSDSAAGVRVVSAAIPLSCSPGYAAGGVGALGGGAHLPLTVGGAGGGAGKRNGPVSQAQLSSQQQKNAVDAGSVVVDGVYKPPPNEKPEHYIFTASGGGLPVTPDLAERLRKPFHLHVEVHDEFHFPDEAAIRTLLDGVTSAAGPAAASSSSASAAQKRLGAVPATAQQLEQQRERAETVVYHLGTALVDPEALVLQPPSAVPHAALLALRAQAEAAGSPPVPVPVPGRWSESTLSAAPVYQREARLLNCRVARSGADQRAARLAHVRARAALREALTAHEAALADCAVAARRQSAQLAAGSAASGSSPKSVAHAGSPRSPRETGGAPAHRHGSFKSAAAQALQCAQAEAAARHAAVARLATKAAVLERRVHELWGRAEAAPTDNTIAVDLKLTIGRGPMSPAAAAAAAQQNTPPPPVANTRTRKGGGGQRPLKPPLDVV